MKIKTKVVLSGLLFLSGLISFTLSVSCRQFPLPPSPVPPASTPTCVWTPLPYGDLKANGTGTYVIRTASDWSNNMFPYPTTIPTPAPPVNLSQFMIIGVSALFSCNYQSVQINSICAYSDHIEVDYGPPPPVIPTPGTPIITCDHINTGTLFAAVPQSNLPVYFNPAATPTPTATP
jgi:hypothetical protein